MISMISILASVPTVPATDVTAMDFTWLFLKMLLMLGVVTVLAVLVLKYAVPHFGIMKRLTRSKYFNVIGRCPLDPRKSLYLVETGGRYFVLGVADHGVNLIAELSEKEALEGLKENIV